jgi:hypothetical protein
MQQFRRRERPQAAATLQPELDLDPVGVR